MSKRKLTDYFKPGNSKNVRKDVDSTVQNEPIIETTTLQDQEVVAIEEDKQFHPSDDFCFPKKKNEERQHPCHTLGSNNSNGCISMSSKWIWYLFTSK